MQYLDKKSRGETHDRRRAGKNTRGGAKGGLFGWLARSAARDGGHADFHRKV